MASIFLTVFLCIYICESDKTIKMIKDKGHVDFLILIYDHEELFNGRLDLYKILYDNNANVLKILYKNSDTVVFEKNTLRKSLKNLFNENSKTNTNVTLKRLYANLYGVIGSSSPSNDFYFSESFKTFDFIMEHNEKLKHLLGNILRIKI